MEARAAIRDPQVIPLDAPLNDQDPLETRLLEEVRAAYECHQAEQTQSTRRLLTKIASLCEQEACGRTAVVKGLRRLGAAGDISTASFPQVADKEERKLHTIDEGSTRTGKEVSQFADLSNDADPDVTSRPHNQCGDSIDSDPQVMAQTLSGTFQDINDKSRAHLAKIFEVPNLSFIEADGTVHRPPSDFETLFGPAMHNFYKSLTQHWCQPMTGCFHKFVHGLPFKLTGGGVILANFFFIIIQTDYQMWALLEKQHNHSAPWMEFAEIALTGYYVFELTCLIIVQRKDFFLGPDMSWNLFDFLIVASGLVDLIMSTFGGNAANLGFLRVLRFFKMSRVLRMFSAARMVKDVKTMIDALTGSFVIFAFGCMVLAMFLSVFGIFFVQGLAGFLEAEEEVDPKLREAIIGDFGSVGVAMRSLFLSVTGGTDWVEQYLTVKAISPIYDYLFLFFMAFTLIAFFNVITGVFAEKAMSLATPTMAELTIRRHNQEIKDAQELVHLLRRVLKHKIKPRRSDISTSGMTCNQAIEDGHSRTACTIDIEAFDDLMTHPEVVGFFAVRGLKATTAHQFFLQLLEFHKAECIDIGKFVSACVKLDGAASSIDIHVLSVEMKMVLMQQHEIRASIQENSKNVTALVATQLAEFVGASPERPAQMLATPTSLVSSAPDVPAAAAAAVPGLERDLFANTKLLNDLQQSAPIVFESTDAIFGVPSGTSISTNANVKLDRVAGDKSADTFLSSCCNVLGGQEEETTATASSTNSASSNSASLGINERHQHFML